MLPAAFAATSGTILPLMEPGLTEGMLIFCHDGRGLNALTPPPPLPPPSRLKPSPSNQTLRRPWLSKSRATDREDVGAGRGKVEVCHAIRHLVVRSIIAARQADGDSRVCQTFKASLM